MQRRHAHLAGRPVAVVAGGRVVGVSPEAAARGVAVGARAVRVKHACPEAEVVDRDAAVCRSFAACAWDICADHSPLVEPAADADDEAFVGLACAWPDPPRDEVARLVAAISAALGVRAVAGLSATRLVARLASAAAAASGDGDGAGDGDGVVVVPPGDEAAFLAPLPVESLWPLGDVAIERLRRLGLHTVGEVAAIPAAVLERRLGPVGRRAAALSHGRDRQPVMPLHPPQRVSLRFVFTGPARDTSALDAALRSLAEEAARRLAAAQEACTAVDLRVEMEDGRSWARARQLARPRASAAALAAAWRRLLSEALAGGEVGAAPVAVEVAATGLRPAIMEQGTLWAGAPRPELRAAPGPAAPPRLVAAIAALHGRFGGGAVVPAATAAIPAEDACRSWREGMLGWLDPWRLAASVARRAAAPSAPVAPAPALPMSVSPTPAPSAPAAGR
jgi:DNA polymerase-4